MPLGNSCQISFTAFDSRVQLCMGIRIRRAIQQVFGILDLLLDLRLRALHVRDLRMDVLQLATKRINMRLLYSLSLNQHLKPSATNGRSLDRQSQLANFCEQLLEGLIAISLR